VDGVYTSVYSENIKVLLNQNSLTSWLIETVLTWICIGVLRFARDAPIVSHQHLCHSLLLVLYY
jgi:hypothetical protein